MACGVNTTHTYLLMYLHVAPFEHQPLASPKMVYLPFYEEQRTLQRVAETFDRVTQEDIARANTRRFNSPTYHSLGESTMSPTPASRPCEPDELEQAMLRTVQRLAGIPANMFDVLAREEKDRLPDQMCLYAAGPRHFQGPDAEDGGPKDLLVMAENNVRAFWVEQRIWDDEWGPAWPSGSFPGDYFLKWEQKGPLTFPRPGKHWGHEKTRQDNESEAEPVGRPAAFGHSAAEQQHSLKSSRNASELDHNASRPLYQFNSQVARERKRLLDENEWKRKTGLRYDDWDDAVAYRYVRDLWHRNDMWRPQWDDAYPGMTWAHEEPEESENDRLPTLPYPDGHPEPPTVGEIADERPSGPAAQPSQKRKRGQGEGSHAQGSPKRRMVSQAGPGGAFRGFGYIPLRRSRRLQGLAPENTIGEQKSPGVPRLVARVEEEPHLSQPEAAQTSRAGHGAKRSQKAVKPLTAKRAKKDVKPRQGGPQANESPKREVGNGRRRSQRLSAAQDKGKVAIKKRTRR